MRCWLAVCLVALAGCYRGPSGLAPCAISCNQGCPSGTSCVNGFCATPGESCASDGGTCGAVGGACCDTAPACEGNAYCAAGTCQAGCVTEVSLGRRHTCVLEHDGSVWCSGNNDNGRLGNGSAGGPNVSAFSPANDASGPIMDATEVCSGYSHSCALRAGGTVSCWGRGDSGQLGNNVYSDSSVAVQVVLGSGSPLTGIAKLACGRSHTCVLATDATVYCWGDNSAGQIGDNTGQSRATALQVPGLTGIVSLQTGQHHICALDNGGQLRCWGRNNDGEIGDGSQNNALAPVAISLANVTAVATGPYHTCALLADSSIDCWGSNTRRWLGTGNGKGNNELTPSPVLSTDGTTPYTGAGAIALGAVSCALRGDNVDCWGDDVHGQTGNGGSFYPRPVATGSRELTGVDKLFASYAHVCAHRGNGDLVCWGRNEAGELGNGTFKNYGYPVPLGATCPATN